MTEPILPSENQSEGHLAQNFSPISKRAEAKEKTKKRDAILLTIVSTMGVLGLVLVLRGSLKTERADEFQPSVGASRATTISDENAKKLNQHPAIEEHQIVAEETKNDVSTKSQFEIRGEKEAKQTLNFVFKHFEQGVNYEIDFGNGNKQRVTSPITHFSYAKAGKYRIVLKATYREQTKILYSDCVAVAEAVEILSGNKEVN